MKIEYCFPIHKYMRGEMEIPDDLLEGKSEDEKWNIWQNYVNILDLNFLQEDIIF